MKKFSSAAETPFSDQDVSQIQRSNPSCKRALGVSDDPRTGGAPTGARWHASPRGKDARGISHVRSQDHPNSEVDDLIAFGRSRASCAILLFERSSARYRPLAKGRGRASQPESRFWCPSRCARIRPCAAVRHRRAAGFPATSSPDPTRDRCPSHHLDIGAGHAGRFVEAHRHTPPSPASLRIFRLPTCEPVAFENHHRPHGAAAHRSIAVPAIKGNR